MVENMFNQMNSIKKLKPSVTPIKFNSASSKNLEKNTHNMFMIYTIIFVIVSILLLCSFCCLYFNFRSIYSNFSRIRNNFFELNNFQPNVEAASEVPDYFAQFENNEETSVSSKHLSGSKTGARKKSSFGKSRFYRSDKYQVDDNERSQPPATLQISSSQTVNAPPINVSPSDKKKLKVIPLYGKLDRFKFKVKLPLKSNIFGWFLHSSSQTVAETPSNIVAKTPSNTVAKTPSNTVAETLSNTDSFRKFPPVFSLLIPPISVSQIDRSKNKDSDC